MFCEFADSSVAQLVQSTDSSVSGNARIVGMFIIDQLFYACSNNRSFPPNVPGWSGTLALFSVLSRTRAGVTAGMCRDLQHRSWSYGGCYPERYPVCTWSWIHFQISGYDDGASLACTSACNVARFPPFYALGPTTMQSTYVAHPHPFDHPYRHPPAHIFPPFSWQRTIRHFSKSSFYWPDREMWCTAVRWLLREELVEWVADRVWPWWWSVMVSVRKDGDAHDLGCCLPVSRVLQ